ncbi:MAG TPA: TonB-dependent receptor [Flavisolibacter sp.]|nr:TonB-dependent receptor [Flavisolibacter sp.]
MRKIFVVAAIITSSHLSAQDSTQVLQEVTLTASKFSTKTTETGKVVTIITRQEIERAGSRDLAQVITDMGGVFINGYRNNAGKEKNIYLRGARVDYTLITIDGIPVYDASGIGSNFDIRFIPIDNVDRIEIVKGSQSTLYGSDAIAGVINIITRKGSARPFGFSSAAHYGSYNTRRLNTTLHGTSGKFDYNIGYSHFKTDGFSEAEQPLNSSELFDKDGYEQNSIQATFGIEASNKVRVQPFIRYSNNSAMLDEDAFNDEIDFTGKTRNLQSGIKNAIQLSNIQLNLLYQYSTTNRNYIDDSLQYGNYFIYNSTDYKAIEHFAELFMVHSFASFKLTAGADLRASNTNYNEIQRNIYSPGIEKYSFSNDTVRHNQTGVYAALNFLKNELNVEGGGRFNHHSEYGSNFAFNFNPSYLVKKKWKVFVNTSTGYKTPSLYQLFSVYGNKDLQPETSLNIEGGVQYFSMNNKVQARVTYFNRKVKDVLAFFFDPVTFRSNYINQDKQHDHGFELETKATFTEKLQLKAIYNYVDGKITSKQNGKDTMYFNLLRRPKSVLTLSAGSQVLKNLYVNFQLNSTGKSKDVYFDPTTFQAIDITLRGYVLLNFYTEYAFAKNRLKLFADLRNLTGARYSDIYGYATPGFNAYGGFRFQL